MFRRAEVPQRSRRSPAGVARGSRGEGPGPPAEAPPGSRRSPAEVAPESRRGRARARCCRTGARCCRTRAGRRYFPWFRRAEVPQKSCRSPAGVVRRSRRDRAGIAPGYFDGFRAVSGVVSYRVFDGKIRRAQLGVVFAGNYLLKKQKRTCRRQVRTGWDGVGRGPDRARTAQVLLLLDDDAGHPQARERGDSQPCARRSQQAEQSRVAPRVRVLWIRVPSRQAHGAGTDAAGRAGGPHTVGDAEERGKVAGGGPASAGTDSRRIHREQRARARD